MTLTFQADELTAVEVVHYMNPSSDEVLEMDMTALRVNAGAFSAPLTRLYREDTDAQVTLPDAPTLAGNVISQRIRNLAGNTVYRLWFGGTTSGNVRWQKVFIVCYEL